MEPPIPPVAEPPIVGGTFGAGEVGGATPGVVGGAPGTVGDGVGSPGRAGDVCAQAAPETVKAAARASPLTAKSYRFIERFLL
ncbi:hypothetical protein [Roseococcus pinisoli]|uniref:Uncharacterized protein n=1 Tax=Roseococcus pinisoli TaxID=2835040 RepID=A0ABS5QBH1_9PROT|nr:hypothetical protein [Roseococcus pinisoli]MBS7810879.1 hypothetical protein [Roseococcus pinisoli]